MYDDETTITITGGKRNGQNDRVYASSPSEIIINYPKYMKPLSVSVWCAICFEGVAKLVILPKVF